MGVTDLWLILNDLHEKEPLTYLSGKKVAIDLSGWVVQALKCKGLNTIKKPHLRNLFFRVSRLLQLGVFPIFVMEGEVPELKKNAIKERNFSRYSENNSCNITRNAFDKIIKECQDLLECIGVPCLKSRGEGEAFCAFLYLNGIVDGVITEDNDAFLYGADVVFRDFSITPTDSHVDVYSLKSERNKLNLDRRKLVALALLLGCDYSKKGLPGVGKEHALKLLSKMECNDILQRFQDWKNLSESDLFPNLNKKLKKIAHCNRCGHPGCYAKHRTEGCPKCGSQITCYLPSDPMEPCTCLWHINAELMEKYKTELKVYSIAKNCSDFPNEKIIQEYLQYDDSIPSNESLQWKCPNLVLFQDIVHKYLHWTLESIQEKFLPIIVSWQLYQLSTHSCLDINNFIYKPAKILKRRRVYDTNYYEVSWTVTNADDNNCIQEDNFTTSEYCGYFSKCYPHIVTAFLNAEAELKEKNQSKSKRKNSRRKDNTEIDNFIVSKSQCIALDVDNSKP